MKKHIIILATAFLLISKEATKLVTEFFNSTLKQ